MGITEFPLSSPDERTPGEETNLPEGRAMIQLKGNSKVPFVRINLEQEKQGEGYTIQVIALPSTLKNFILNGKGCQDRKVDAGLLVEGESCRLADSWFGCTDDKGDWSIRVNVAWLPEEGLKQLADQLPSIVEAAKMTQVESSAEEAAKTTVEKHQPVESPSSAESDPISKLDKFSSNINALKTTPLDERKSELLSRLHDRTRQMKESAPTPVLDKDLSNHPGSTDI